MLLSISSCECLHFLTHQIVDHACYQFTITVTPVLGVSVLQTASVSLSGIDLRSATHQSGAYSTGLGLSPYMFGIKHLRYCCFSFQPVLHDWCNKGCGMYYPVCGMMHIKEPLLLIGKSSLCGGSGFPLSLSDWSSITVNKMC